MNRPRIVELLDKASKRDIPANFPLNHMDVKNLMEYVLDVEKDADTYRKLQAVSQPIKHA